MSGGTKSTDSGFVSRSHRAIEAFDLHRPSTASDVAQLMKEGAHACAGGIDLVERMQGGGVVDQVVSLAAVDELDVIEVVGDRLRIGAIVTHARIESDPLVNQHRPDLAAAWKTVGNVRIRRTGTVGGNLMAFEKDYDAAPILAAVDATLHFFGDSTARAVGDRRAGELLQWIELPLGGKMVFDRDLKPTITVAAGDDKIVLGCAFEQPYVVDRPSGSPTQAAAEIAGAMPTPLDDADASAAYRRRMAAVMIGRCLERLESGT